MAVSIVGGLGVGMVWTNTDAIVSNLAKKERLAATLGAAGSFKELSDMLGPLLIGLASQAFGLRTGFVICGVLGLASVGLLALAPRVPAQSGDCGAHLALGRKGMTDARATLAIAARKLAERLSLRVLTGFGAAALLLWGFAELAEEVLEGDTWAFDEAVRAPLHAHASPPLTGAMKAVTTLGSVPVLVGFTGIALAALAAARRRRSTLLLAVTMIGATALNWSLKISFRRMRPEPFFDVLPCPPYVFDSSGSSASPARRRARRACSRPESLPGFQH